jgi:hypothetical protein
MLPNTRGQSEEKKQIARRTRRAVILLFGAAGALALAFSLADVFLRTSGHTTPAPFAIFISIFSGLVLFWLSICLVVILDSNR